MHQFGFIFKQDVYPKLEANQHNKLECSKSMHDERRDQVIIMIVLL